jgi:peptidoglycan hydrolase CwlO-like protein
MQKIEQNRPENKLKAMQKRIDEIDKASAERKEKIKASTERIALLKEQLKKYKR